MCTDKMYRIIYLLSLFGFTQRTFASTESSGMEARSRFIAEFSDRQLIRPPIVCFMSLQSKKMLSFHKGLSGHNFVSLRAGSRTGQLVEEDRILYVADLKENHTIDLLLHSQNLLLNPSIWMLFYTSETSLIQHNDDHNDKSHLEKILEPVHIPVNSEVYVVIQNNELFKIFLVYRLKQAFPLIWERYGYWHPSTGFDRAAPNQVLAMRRLNLQKLPVVVASAMLDDRTWEDHKDYHYQHRSVDPHTVLIYYLVQHLFEMLNATGIVNRTKTFGYLLPDGTFDGILKEIAEGRSEISGTVLMLTHKRMSVVQYIAAPGPVMVAFIFKKPNLAAVSNIYILPFSFGVWISLLVLIFVCIFVAYAASFWETKLTDTNDISTIDRITQNFIDMLSLVFQQGTFVDPISVTSRHILLLAVLAFMFLYEAYSANVVALLQSTTNNIDSVDALVKSPLAIGAENYVYSRKIFPTDTRPAHKALWLKKGLPQGENFFVSLEEGVRRIREGLYALHMEKTAGFELMQKTFLPHENCNLGMVTYIPNIKPHIAIARRSFIAEQLRIGTQRMMERGVQSRSVRRVVIERPQCNTGSAMFAPVSLMDVAPAFKCLLLLYGAALALFALELFIYKRDLRKQKRNV